MKNEVILVTDPIQGCDVKKYWLNQGARCVCFYFDPPVYYGYISGIFGAYTLEQVQEAGAEIITLPEEKTFPRPMLVSDDKNEWKKRVVYAIDENLEYPIRVYSRCENLSDIEKGKEVGGIFSFAKEIDEVPQEKQELLDTIKRLESELQTAKAQAERLD